MSKEEQNRVEDRLNAQSLDNFFRFETKTHHAILARINQAIETEREELIPFNMHIIEVPIIHER